MGVNILTATPRHPERNYRPALDSHYEAAIHAMQCEHTVYQVCSFARPNPDDKHAVVLDQYQYINRLMQWGDFDVLVTLEDDMIVPDNAITRLVQHIVDGADVAYGLYVFRDVRNWNAYTKVGDKTGDKLNRYPSAARRMFGQVVSVEGVGLGCTAIAAHVLRRVFFTRRGTSANDWYFAQDCRDLGLTQVCDTGIVCGHMLSESKAIYPDPTTESMYKIEALA